MTNNSLQLEALVRRIVREVLAGGNVPTNKSSDSVRRLCLSDLRVVTMAELDSDIDGFDEVSVGEKTVVTPAARDMLRSRGIALTRGTTGKSQPKLNQQDTIWITDANSPDRQAAFARQLALRNSSNVQSSSMDQASIVLADVPQLVTWELCQTGRVAAQIGSLEELERVKTEMKPSTWVLDMRRLNIASATNIALRIIREEK